MPTLRRLRRLRGMTQRELAAAAGVSAQTIVQVEGGRRPARPWTMRQIAAALGVAIADVDDFRLEEERDERRRLRRRPPADAP